MNPSAFAFLVVSIYCSGMVMSTDNQEPAFTNKGRERIFVPLPFIPVPAIPTQTPAPTTAATTTVAPTQAPDRCPARCCKAYCVNGNFCTAAAGPVYTCDPVSDAQKCLNSASSGCSGCTAPTACPKECGEIMAIPFKMAFCPAPPAA